MLVSQPAGRGKERDRQALQTLWLWRKGSLTWPEAALGIREQQGEGGRKGWSSYVGLSIGRHGAWNGQHEWPGHRDNLM